MLLVALTVTFSVPLPGGLVATITVPVSLVIVAADVPHAGRGHRAQVRAADRHLSTASRRAAAWTDPRYRGAAPQA